MVPDLAVAMLTNLPLREAGAIVAIARDGGVLIYWRGLELGRWRDRDGRLEFWTDRSSQPEVEVPTVLAAVLYTAATIDGERAKRVQKVKAAG